jgi:hypothetical protein
MTPQKCAEIIKTNKFAHKFATNCKDNFYSPVGRARNPRCELCALIKGSQEENFAKTLRIDEVGVYINED